MWIRICRVLYGYGTEQELTEAGADHIIRTVAELEDYLRNQGENPAKLTWYDRLKGRTEEGKETDMIRFGMIGTERLQRSSGRQTVMEKILN